jgi:hypothetical protein
MHAPFHCDLYKGAIALPWAKRASLRDFESFGEASFAASDSANRLLNDILAATELRR